MAKTEPGPRRDSQDRLLRGAWRSGIGDNHAKYRSDPAFTTKTKERKAEAEGPERLHMGDADRHQSGPDRVRLAHPHFHRSSCAVLFCRSESVQAQSG